MWAYPPPEGVSQQLGGVAADCARVGVALRPPQQLPAADGGLLHREAEAEAHHRLGALQQRAACTTAL